MLVTRAAPGKHSHRPARHWVLPAGTKRMTTRETTDGEIRARYSAESFQRLQRIDRTRRFKATRAAKPSAEQQPVSAHDTRQQVSRQTMQSRQQRLHDQAQKSATRFAAAIKTWSSSSRTVRLRCWDDALTNWTRSNGDRNRTTHKPAASCCMWRSIAARI